jgi:hypothetical protein
VSGSSERLQGSKPLDLASVLKKKIQPTFRRIGIMGVGWHTFRHLAGTMLAEMSEHQLTIRAYLRHSNLHVTNKYLQGTSKTKRFAQDKLVDAILPTGILPKTNLIQRALFSNRSGMEPGCKCLKRMAGTTGLEPAASAVTGQRSNQLNYVPNFLIDSVGNLAGQGFRSFAHQSHFAAIARNGSCPCQNR